MADPFSIVSGAVGVIDVCWRVGKFLRDVKAATDRIESDIVGLISEVENARRVVESIRETFDRELSSSSSFETALPAELNRLWQNIRESFDDCQSVVEDLEALARQIYGKAGPKVHGRLDGLAKQSRKRDKTPLLQETRQRLSACIKGLQLLFTAINMYGSMTI